MILGSLIGLGSFGVVDDEHFNGSSCGFEFEAELLLERREHRRRVGIDRRDGFRRGDARDRFGWDARNPLLLESTRCPRNSGRPGLCTANHTSPDAA